MRFPTYFLSSSLFAVFLACALYPLIKDKSFDLQLPIVAVLLFVWVWLARPRTVPRFEGCSNERNRRKNISKLRSSCKLFPSPYPNGWYFICRSSDVERGQTLAVTAFGKEIAVFRGENGEVGVLHAFCPHLGTHLGHGGKVKGNNLVCPYHSWAFDKEGTCQEIPYCDKDMASLGKRVNAPAYTMCEKEGLVFAWFHADDAPPFYQVTILDEIEEKGMYMVGDFAVPDWHCHIMEFAQNSTDWYHFRTVHQWLGQADSDWFKLLWVQHTCKTSLKLLRGCVEKDGSQIPDEIIYLTERPSVMKLFGVLPIPSIFYEHFSSEARFQGPQLSVFKIDSPLGSVRVFFSFTPEKPFLSRTTVRCFASPWVPRWIAALFAMHAIATVEQDRKVWENKLTIAPRNLVRGDGPFACFGTWLKQFYSESSPDWSDASLDW